VLLTCCSVTAGVPASMLNVSKNKTRELSPPASSTHDGVIP
jgi:hypothetical protein